MKILINTFGTRGDIQPYIALAKGLQNAHYEVAIGTAEGFRQDIEAENVPYLWMKNDLLELTRALLEAETMGARFSVMRQMGPAVRRMMDDEWHAAHSFQPDLILYHPKCLGTYHVAEKLNIPAILSIPLPFYTPTSHFAVPFVAKNLGATLNRMTYGLIPLSGAAYSGTVNDFRQKTLGLPPIGSFTNLLQRSNGEAVPVIYPVSPHVVPVPADYPAHVHMTGYLFLNHDADWQPDPALLDFLNGGSKPVYIGFGSMSAANVRQRTQHVIEAVKNSGQRAIFSSGWSELSTFDFPDSIHVVKSVPHDWLFPQVAAAVHHGGAGTTAASLRAGKPTIICPIAGDQPFWGKRVFDLGVGPKPIGQNWITADNLAEAITETLTNSAMQSRAAELGKLIAAEDGIGNAVKVIASVLNNRPIVSAPPAN